MTKIFLTAAVLLSVVTQADAKGPIRRLLFGDGCRARATRCQPAQAQCAPAGYSVPAYSPVPVYAAPQARPFQPVSYTHDFPVVNAVRSACQNGQCPKAQ